MTEPVANPNLASSPCEAQWSQETLTLHNALFREQWRAEPGGLLRLVSFRRAGGPEWVAPRVPPRPAPEADPLSERPAGPETTTPWLTQFSTERAATDSGPAGIVTANLRLTDPATGRWRHHQFRLHPAIAGAIHHHNGPEIEIALDHYAGTAAGNSQLTGRMRLKPNGQMFATLPAIAHPLFELASRHLRVREVEFVDQTDHHSNLVFEREWMTHPGERCRPVSSNLVCIEDPATAENEGFFWLLLAPLPRVRRDWSSYYDILLAFQDGRLLASACPAGYALARVAYSCGRQGATTALHELQRVFYEASPPRRGMILSNTWGDRAGAAHLCEAFVLEEIAAARDLGVEIVQIDDGWQRGATVNTTASGGVWNGFWAADPEFWTPHPARFPRGIAPLAQAARDAGVHLGLWYAPDSTADLTNWERDAAQILSLWREHGIAFFKLDAVKLHSRLAETRFHALCDRVLQASAGAIFFDFDATAEHRPTYWGRPGGGALFLENRFTELAGYHPHQTLRALWSLAHYVRPERIRAEFLNPVRNDADYGTDPLRPSAYPPQYLFAITMAASPLAWFEVCRVPPAIAAQWRPLIALWKEHREDFHRGSVVPIGQVPDGYAWSGFVSVPARAGTSVTTVPRLYALIFRETTQEAAHSFALPETTDNGASGEARVLAGEGSAAIDRDGRMVARIPSARSFLLVAWFS